MADALEAVVKECLADSPAAVLITWESNGKMTTRTLPDSVMVQKGFIYTLYEVLFEGEGTSEE